MSGFALRFLTRRGCHLCQDALPMVLTEASRRGFTVAEVDIDSSATLRERFGARVPVVLGPDSEVIAEGRIDQKRLRRALRAV